MLPKVTSSTGIWRRDILWTMVVKLRVWSRGVIGFEGEVGFVGSCGLGDEEILGRWAAPNMLFRLISFCWRVC
jgi:hypothetical protein